MGREIRAEQASLGFSLRCRPGCVVSVRGCGEDPGPGRPGHLLVLGLQPDSVLSSWTQVYLSVNFLLETLVIRQLWDD